ncbi:hypothetical protein [Bacillus cereus]|nr:hypothetical protein [Bacillus cereus]
MHDDLIRTPDQTAHTFRFGLVIVPLYVAKHLLLDEQIHKKYVQFQLI